MTTVVVHRALLSVSDKAGIVELATRLANCGVELVSSGGTAAALQDAGLAVTAVADVTGAAEMLGGRVKTLHPAIHGAILADLGDPSHVADLEERGIAPFQLVVVDLYPFERTAASGTERRAIVEQIDIGGPAMVRAAAKNHAWVGAVTSPRQYEAVAAAVESGGLPEDLRRSLATEAFFRTAAYDAAILAWLEGGGGEMPDRMVLALERAASLRYGENPHQAAAVYAARFASPWWRTAEQLQGKEMSFNNYSDAEAAWRLVNDLPPPAAVIVKHTNACGAATAATAEEAFRRAWECDPTSAFGGVVAVNAALDGTAGAAIASRFVEVVVAPSIDEAAGAALAAKQDVRLLIADPPHGLDLDLRRVEDGLLAQTRDAVVDDDGWQVVTAREPDGSEIDDLRFAWIVAAHTKSNAVVIARDGAAVGVGAGDQSRVGAAERAVARAGERAESAAAASDAFFPFRDGLDVLAAAGVTAVIQPGGSMRDEEVVAAANEHGMAMVFTGRRHFRH